ncbi:MAG: TIGR03067 domain-containing protein [Verrucomicrobia bacterium]|nr:TIGR03067 domain-containing protein [Verrucomicrobiota bacterium]
MTARGASELEGTWAMVRAASGGQAAPDLVAKHTTLEFTGQSYRVQFAREIVEAGTFELPGDPMPGTIRLHSTAGPNAGRILAGTYQLRGGLLRVSWALPEPPPTDSAAPPGQAGYRATYRRSADKILNPSSPQLPIPE